MIGGTCAACGLRGHRYGTTDTEHEFDAMGCVNSLRGEVERLRAALTQIAEVDYRGSRSHESVIAYAALTPSSSDEREVR